MITKLGGENSVYSPELFAGRINTNGDDDHHEINSLGALKLPFLNSSFLLFVREQLLEQSRFQRKFAIWLWEHSTVQRENAVIALHNW